MSSCLAKMSGKVGNASKMSDFQENVKGCICLYSENLIYHNLIFITKPDI